MNENMNINPEETLEVVEEFMEVNPKPYGIGALIGAVCTGLVVVGVKFLGPKIADKYSEFKNSREIKKAEKNGTVEEVNAEIVNEEDK